MIRNTSHRVLYSGLGAAILGLALTGCGGNKAADNPEPTTDTGTAPSTNTGAPSTASQNGGKMGNMAMPDAASFKDAAAIWKQVTAAKANLDNIIKAKKLKEVHEAAFKVRDILNTLPAKSKALPADKQKTLASQVKNVAQLAGLLDESGDANNLKETQENQAGLNDALDIIKGLYPAGALGKTISLIPRALSQSPGIPPSAMRVTN
jgi:hypothetical protein